MEIHRWGAGILKLSNLEPTVINPLTLGEGGVGLGVLVENEERI